MKCEIIIDNNCEEKIIVYARDESPLVKEIKRLADESEAIIGYKDKQIINLNPYEIICVTVIGNKVYAVCENEQFLLKERLYTLEEKLPDTFIKINQSCIANTTKIERFDSSISGTMKLHFRNGWSDYVSRRQLKFIKERFGI